MRSSGRIFAIALMFPVALAISLPAPAAAQSAMVAGEVTQDELLEPRWLPWLGCWELTADVVDNRQIEDTGRRVVCVAPRLDGLGVNLTTHMDSQVIAQNTVVADGQERVLPETDCSGTQTANWSADGHRLYSSVTAACANQIERSLVGLSMLVEGNVWIELQSVSLDGGEHRELLVRQYKRVADTETLELGFTPLEPGLAARAATARAGASGPLDVDDVLEAAEQAPVEIVEAAILESNSLFALDSGALIRLADAGVEERIIDLMVAISYPEQFIVDRGRSSGGGGGGGGGTAARRPATTGITRDRAGVPTTAPCTGRTGRDVTTALPITATTSRTTGAAAAAAASSSPRRSHPPAASTAARSSAGAAM